MRILLSAYACEPGKGSEPGVGWNWALALSSMGHSVHVLTRSNNRAAIEDAVARLSPDTHASQLRFSYFDLPPAVRRWKHRPGGIHFYYLLWQWGAFRTARGLHRDHRFDCVHHVTFAGFRQPSFMGRLGIPFLFGPVGGGERSPVGLRGGLPRKGRMLERLRDNLNAMARLDPLMLSTYRAATVIACTTSETQARIPARFQRKTMVLPTIGIAPEHIGEAASSPPASPVFLFVGRLLYWKGVHLALRALAEVRHTIPGVRLRIIGQGPDAHWLKSVARSIDVEAAVDWTDWISHEDMLRAYGDHTAFLFPSLHDSGGMVVLEAMAAGLPVICLRAGGPALFVDSSCGFSIPAGGSEGAVVSELAQAMTRLGQDGALRARLSKGALARARELSWTANARELYAAAFPSDTAAGVAT